MGLGPIMGLGPPRVGLTPSVGQEELPEVTAQELKLLLEAEPELLLPEEEVPEVPPAPAPRPPPEPGLPLEIPSPPRRRRPAPQLPHIDLQTQIPQETFRAQLELPHIGCGELLLLPPPSKRCRTPAELFRTPTCGWLPPELLALWLRCTRPGPPRPTAPPPELPSEVEVLREALEPSLVPLLSSEVSLETPEEEPRPRLLPPEERRLLPPPAPQPCLSSLRGLSLNCPLGPPQTWRPGAGSCWRPPSSQGELRWSLCCPLAAIGAWWGESSASAWPSALREGSDWSSPSPLGQSCCWLRPCCCDVINPRWPPAMTSANHRQGWGRGKGSR
ncbi:meiotic recombination protein REC8 homolog [Pogoniulus pusillus]|uniref:meiotic recombination protein REC8 homolog n=1 Tax=Pogoniulus pusillus TaxID=488313 RepID=UPI0030B96BE7